MDIEALDMPAYFTIVKQQVYWMLVSPIAVVAIDNTLLLSHPL